MSEFLLCGLWSGMGEGQSSCAPAVFDPFFALRIAQLGPARSATGVAPRRAEAQRLRIAARSVRLGPGRRARRCNHDVFFSVPGCDGRVALNRSCVTMVWQLESWPQIKRTTKGHS